jgi:hypothetical protein
MIYDGEHIFYAEVDTFEEAVMCIEYKMLAGWHIACMPFPSRYGLVDLGEETTAIQPSKWTVLLHHHRLSEQAS